MRQARNIFWIVFALSILFICGVTLLLGALGGVEPEGPEPDRENMLVWVPLVTAIVSLIGAVVTTIGTIRKDRLETRKAELELEERKLELEKKRLDAEIEIAKKQRQLDELQKRDQQGGG